MSYTIGEVAKKMNLSLHTIRYYENALKAGTTKTKEVLYK